MYYRPTPTDVAPFLMKPVSSSVSTPPVALVSPVAQRRDPESRPEHHSREETLFGSPHPGGDVG